MRWSVARLSCLAIALAASAGTQGCVREPAASGFEHVLTVAPSGAVVSGSKAALAEAVRQGGAVRVGFGIDFDDDGTIDLEHWAAAAFVSLYRGEIFVQLAPIQEQNPAADKPEIRFAASAHPWTGMLDTTARLQSWFPGEPASDLQVTSWWYVMQR